LIKTFFISTVVLIIVLTWLTERDWGKKKTKWNKRKKRYE
tara:strand:- start:21570 stop:21689 length:120 start_codon:yes stop_codon:yes gene_type:complete